MRFIKPDTFESIPWTEKKLSKKATRILNSPSLIKWLSQLTSAHDHKAMPPPFKTFKIAALTPRMRNLKFKEFSMPPKLSSAAPSSLSLDGAFFGTISLLQSQQLTQTFRWRRLYYVVFGVCFFGGEREVRGKLFFIPWKTHACVFCFLSRPFGPTSGSKSPQHCGLTSGSGPGVYKLNRCSLLRFLKLWLWFFFPSTINFKSFFL